MEIVNADSLMFNHTEHRLPSPFAKLELNGGRPRSGPGTTRCFWARLQLTGITRQIIRTASAHRYHSLARAPAPTGHHTVGGGVFAHATAEVYWPTMQLFREHDGEVVQDGPLDILQADTVRLGASSTVGCSTSQS